MVANAALKAGVTFSEYVREASVKKAEKDARGT
jgi:hypothetical protein